MFINLFFFFTSFFGDFLALYFYQRYLNSHKKDTINLLYAVISGCIVWLFIFKLQDRGQILRFFIPTWSAGTAIFGYIAGGYVNGTPMKELFNFQAIMCVLAIGIGIYFLNRFPATP